MPLGDENTVNPWVLELYHTPHVPHGSAKNALAAGPQCHIKHMPIP